MSGSWRQASPKGVRGDHAAVMGNSATLSTTVQSTIPLAGGRSLGETIDHIARQAGVDVVGFGDVQEALPREFSHLPVGVSLGVSHPALRLLREGSAIGRAEAVRRALSDHRDTRGQAILETALHRMADYLRRNGYRYFCCPPEVDPMETPFAALMVRRFSHKAAATCAGLGSVGRHGLLNHPEYGPHVVWATLVTNAPLGVSEPTHESDCGECRRCVAACPGGAITGKPWRREDGMVRLVDTERCRLVLDENERVTGRRVCGRCAMACAMARLVDARAED